MMGKWKEAEKECPEFYRLKHLLGDRTNVSTHTVNNSRQSLDLESIQPGSSRRAASARTGSEDKAEMDPDAAAEEESDMHDAEGDEDVIAITREGVPIIVVTEASPRKNKGKQKDISRDPSPNSSTSASTTSRKRVITETEHLLTYIDNSVSRKTSQEIS